jgi:HAD superfamily hydrolase (TIGR01484 family)
VQEIRAMRYHALAADYDGTLAHHGRIDDETWAALRKLRDGGRKLIMVTGRELDELLALLGEGVELFDRIVAENGGLVYEPATKDIRPTCAEAATTLVEALARRGVARVAVGRTIIATWEPHQDDVLHAIQELGLELQVIFNKGAVMVLPSGVNKATGLAIALGEMGLSPHNVVAVGDAENDHALLELCECGVAVANALPALKERADWVTKADHGAGVREIIEELANNDLASVALRRHGVVLGMAGDREVTIDPYAATVMVCGTSGAGKSTLTTGFLERLGAKNYQFAIVDPEGDYETLDFAIALGSPQRAPLVAEITDLLRTPKQNVAINLLGLAVEHRPEFFEEMLPALAELRSRTGRPHWLVIDEAHHLLPAARKPSAMTMRPHGTLYITVHPESVARSVIDTLDTLIVIGEHVDQTVRDLCKIADLPVPELAAEGKLPTGSALYWKVGSLTTCVVTTEPPKTERKRHSRKYMEGNLGADRAFYFRGPDGKLNLKAHNLQLFVHLAEGVDDDTWNFHAAQHHYSQWLRTEVKDAELAAEIEQLEADGPSREDVRAAIERRYTVPADKPSGVIDPPDDQPAA